MSKPSQHLPPAGELPAMPFRGIGKWKCPAKYAGTPWRKGRKAGKGLKAL